MNLLRWLLFSDLQVEKERALSYGENVHNFLSYILCAARVKSCISFFPWKILNGHDLCMYLSIHPYWNAAFQKLLFTLAAVTTRWKTNKNQTQEKRKTRRFVGVALLQSGEIVKSTVCCVCYTSKLVNYKDVQEHTLFSPFIWSAIFYLIPTKTKNPNEMNHSDALCPKQKDKNVDAIVFTRVAKNNDSIASRARCKCSIHLIWL